jgi:hypothetical protein
MGHRGPARLSCQSPWRAGPQPATGNAAPPAGRRSGPKGQAGASAGGLAGAAPSHPRRSGGPYRRPAARRRSAAAAPWERPTWGRSLARIEQNITVLYAGRAMAGRAPAHHPHAFSPPKPGPGGLANCGVAGLCTRHRPDGAPAIIQNNLFCSDRARHGQRLNLWRRRFPWLAERPAPGPASGAPLAMGRGAGGSGPGWAEERPGGPGRSQSPGSGAGAEERPGGPGRSQRPQAPPFGGRGGEPRPVYLIIGQYVIRGT